MLRGPMSGDCDPTGGVDFQSAQSMLGQGGKATDLTAPG